MRKLLNTFSMMNNSIHNVLVNGKDENRPIRVYVTTKNCGIQMIQKVNALIL